MRCPDDVADVLLQILGMAVLRIRNDESGRDIEADHVHNLAPLVRDYRPELLEYYWTVERPGYISQRPDVARHFESLWTALHACMQRHGLKVTSA